MEGMKQKIIVYSEVTRAPGARIQLIPNVRGWWVHAGLLNNEGR